MGNRSTKIPDLSYDLIKRAVAGEEEALKTLLQRYDTTINRWATTKEYNRDGVPITRVDEDMKAFIQGRFVDAVMKNWRELI